MMMARRNDQIRALFELAERKGHDATKAVLRDHFRLVTPAGEVVKRANGSTAHSLTEATEYLEKLPDRKVSP
jgi:hypothetical protein